MNKCATTAEVFSFHKT